MERRRAVAAGKTWVSGGGRVGPAAPTLICFDFGMGVRPWGRLRPHFLVVIGAPVPNDPALCMMP